MSCMCCSYKGHKNKEYKIDNCLDCKDTHVLGGSEDGNVYIWDLVEVSKSLHTYLCINRLILEISHSYELIIFFY